MINEICGISKRFQNEPNGFNAFENIIDDNDSSVNDTFFDQSSFPRPDDTVPIINDGIERIIDLEMSAIQDQPNLQLTTSNTPNFDHQNHVIASCNADFTTEYITQYLINCRFNEGDSSEFTTTNSCVTTTSNDELPIENKYLHLNSSPLLNELQLYSVIDQSMDHSQDNRYMSSDSIVHIPSFSTSGTEAMTSDDHIEQDTKSPSPPSIPKSKEKITSLTQKPQKKRPGRKPILPRVPGDKPFRCPTCGRCFKRNEHLKRHQSSVHMNSRLFECTICRKTFTRTDNLTSHIDRTHLGITKSKKYNKFIDNERLNT